MAPCDVEPTNGEKIQLIKGSIDSTHWNQWIDQHRKEEHPRTGKQKFQKTANEATEKELARKKERVVQRC